MISFVSETPAHAAAIERVLARAFGPGRFAKTSERVREQGAHFEPGLSRVAVDETGAVLGCCRIWSVGVGDRKALFLGPLAVDPDRQRDGQGASLVRECIAACRAAGGEAIILVGAAPFFQPLGFSIAPAGRISLPGPVDPQRLLWIGLRTGALDALKGAVSAPRAAMSA